MEQIQVPRVIISSIGEGDDPPLLAENRVDQVDVSRRYVDEKEKFRHVLGKHYLSHYVEGIDMIQERVEKIEKFRHVIISWTGVP